MRFNRIIPAFAFLALAMSCEQEPKGVFTSTELGAPTKEYIVNYEPGEVKVNVYSNSDYTITRVGGDDWVENPSASKLDEGFTILYSNNEGYPRSAMFILAIDQQKDTVYLRQDGRVSANLSISDPGVAPKGSTKENFDIALDTNVRLDEIKVEIVYENEDVTGWVENATVTDKGTLGFSTAANDSDSPRKAQIRLSFVDGWDRKIEVACYVSQMNRNDEMGSNVSFEQVRALGKTDPGFKITDDIIISGIVVSDRKSKNMGENPRNTITYVDYSICEKTVYIESLDGKYGFKLQTSSADYNTFKKYDQVSLNLKGTTIIKNEEPEFYDITGINSWSIVSLKAGSERTLPVKEMHMNELQDSDIYTFVQLQDCELPVRKGSMSPINEGYSIAGNANRSTKAAILLRDINGDDMYVLTNTTCPYRRTGARLPYGSGTMSGIIVHEKHTSFNYMDNDSGNEDTYGYIGRYQIRHTCLADFGMEQDFRNGFSELLTEYRFIRGEYQAKQLPTYGENGYMTHSFKYTASSSHGEGNTAIIGAEEFSYLGPIGTSASYAFGYNSGNINGLGIIMDNCKEFPDGYDWGSASTGTAFEGINKTEAGKGKTPKACLAAWSCWYNWNRESDRPYSWIFEFSTLGISTSQLSMQVAMLNLAASNDKVKYAYGPRHWEVQWSTTGRDEYDEDWTTVLEEFMVPDTVNWTPATQAWMSPAHKPINVRLPLEMLNRPQVFIRIRPLRQMGGDYTSFNVPPTDGNWMMPSTAMSYFAIRYNK